ncbi:hypothetical protein A3C09_00640 [Candidatus Uhrbacteria bacterium RIFCSPHIGHO2_02_FULL_47_44]|uniref:Uncharacterized protein n=1 Tax=Candidatus Uhrbacteria bacterium RIFCSPLOWO2_02_FULL_48_18 TaxID=1802408 RepID=A0A1F7V8T0_9BACT|nr:MAG: hypothetical protein A2839_04910 [Candidatus Uhrbacteria bacterium RIFCSPHIGHO2_01_FULL_47_10]OGL70845.1 MAG: hypothetical protein A3C09_00640 [Candidatus Uhrbacteria bacterium RIFCSPHIGHO2_02_FULL_47_44]OGL82604.1 MAG: hypothetical protein A3B20_00160 [Candidatus Uhrbacteria bacterium RIFCSPLOWO2_01_FULL_47_17]OGL86815.1 MAG: hypothetical protein A3I41_04530 [Candidatus Uhrbacteria bacterium RIFCSPLOWO2_02_FULL_48_18]OGL91749.1 MAG: hypothetical protein A3H12_00525 [Candidatus Uhrbacte
MQDNLKHAAVLALVVGLLLGGVGGYKYAQKSAERLGSEAGVTQSSTYQAVFLTNGSLYFGKLSGEGTDHPVLREVYYLQAGQPQTKNAQTKLIKLGGEVQGPKDEMRLNPQQIMYVQDLKDDGDVVKAIKAYTK